MTVLHVPRIAVAPVIARACEYLEISEDELKSPSRKAHLTRARAVIAVILREAGASFPWIAPRIGVGHHTSVMHLVLKFREWAESYPHLADAKAYAESGQPRKPVPVKPLVLAQAGIIDVVRAEPRKRPGRYVPKPFTINFAGEDEDGETCHDKRVRQSMVIGSALLLDALKSARAA